MIPVPANPKQQGALRVWLATGDTDMRRGFPGLALRDNEQRLRGSRVARHAHHSAVGLCDHRMWRARIRVPVWSRHHLSGKRHDEGSLSDDEAHKYGSGEDRRSFGHLDRLERR